MSYTFAQYQESADYLRTQTGTFIPKVAMILGSGLGYLGDEVEQPIRVPYSQIPHFKTSTAPGHKVSWYSGLLDGQNVAGDARDCHSTPTRANSLEEVTFAGPVLQPAGRGHPDCHQCRRLRQPGLEIPG